MERKKVSQDREINSQHGWLALWPARKEGHKSGQAVVLSFSGVGRPHRCQGDGWGELV